MKLILILFMIWPTWGLANCLKIQPLKDHGSLRLDYKIKSTPNRICIKYFSHDRGFIDLLKDDMKLATLLTAKQSSIHVPGEWLSLLTEVKLVLLPLSSFLPPHDASQLSFYLIFNAEYAATSGEKDVMRIGDDTFQILDVPRGPGLCAPFA